MPPPAASFDAIRAAYALGPGEPPRRVGERVWHLPGEGGGFAVKCYAAAHRARAEKEAAVLAHLAAHDDARFRIQRLRCTSSGAPLWSDGSTHAMLTHWQDGRFRTYDTFTPAEWAALGASLAALHGQLDGLRLPAADTIRTRLEAIDVEAVRRSLHNACDQARHRADAEPLYRYADLARRLLDHCHPGSLAAFPADDPQHPIHNDYNQFNYLFTPALPPVILDWEAAIGAPREYELVRCLNHLPLEAPALAEAFVLAYLRVRPVAAERFAWAVDAACLQHAIKLWVVQGWLDEPARFAVHLAGAVTMAGAMVDARGPLVDFFSRCAQAGR
ncbi:aminoglycoside phosphotransferase [Burkholderia sp. 22PA0106]|uniref:aminoglycoside phosphotransferase n=1 Tax=Burkholderia sp. 22PA0106 TaxID=3237371 RepID=UPI0039C2AFAB